MKPLARKIALAVCLAMLAPAIAARAQDAGRVTLEAPAAVLTLELATNESTRSHGLMERTNLAPHTGMLFVFPREGAVTFWMKNTLIPLDMVFIAQNGNVTGVAANVPATKHDTADAQIPRRAGHAKYVIELPANEATRDGIKPGIKLPIHAIAAK